MDRLDRTVVQVKQLATALVLIGGTLALAAATQPVRTLKLADLRQTIAVQEPRISPDGAHVAAYVTQRDYDKNKTLADLTLFDVRTHAARKLTRDGISAPFAWSPDGSSIAYVAKSDDATQLFIMPMDGGEPLKLTDEKNGVDDFAWRPDGKTIAYAATPESPNKKALDHHEDAFNVTEEAWTAQAPADLDQLYTIDVRESAKAHHVGNGTWNVGGGFTYAADGRSIFVTRVTEGFQPGNESAREIVRVDLASGHISNIARLSKTQLNPYLSRDGKRLSFAFANPKFGPLVEVALADANGTSAIWASHSLDRPVAAWDFMPDNSLVVAAPDSTRFSLFHLTPAGAMALPLGDLNASSVSVARNGTIAFTANSPKSTGDLYVLLPGATTPTRLTNENPWLDKITLGRHETVTWRTRSGFTANGVLVYPPN